MMAKLIRAILFGQKAADEVGDDGLVRTTIAPRGALPYQILAPEPGLHDT
jgi:hypothetical protein